MLFDDRLIRLMQVVWPVTALTHSPIWVICEGVDMPTHAALGGQAMGPIGRLVVARPGVPPGSPKNLPIRERVLSALPPGGPFD
jgi:hypothetical protein